LSYGYAVFPSQGKWRNRSYDELAGQEIEVIVS
jgi:hypothetical protein